MAHLVLMPVPDRVTVCGDPDALSVTVKAPERVPVTVGVKVTLMVQLMPGASVAPQPLVSLKSPEALMEEIESVPVPTFFRVAATATEVVLTN